MGPENLGQKYGKSGIIAKLMFVDIPHTSNRRQVFLTLFQVKVKLFFHLAYQCATFPPTNISKNQSNVPNSPQTLQAPPSSYGSLNLSR